MRNTRLAGQALSLATDTARRPYICRACLAQTTRQFSTSTPQNAAAEPFYKRIQNSLFGTKESKAAEERREASRKKQLEELKESGPDRVVEKLTLRNGVEYVVADLVDPTTHSDYVVSKDWEGMERIGSEKWVRERADSGEVYTGFLPQKQAKLSNEEWEALLRTVAAEVLALREAGRDVLQVCNPRTIDADTVRNGSGKSSILASIPETAQEERAPGALESELEQALLTRANGAQLGMALNDPSIKFAIIKRTMQLTGKRVSDVILSNAQSLGSLTHAFAAREPPKKLHDTHQLQAASQQPNIQVHETRRTHVHRDKAIGRWKLIEDELSLRDMPTSRPAAREA